MARHNDLLDGKNVSEIATVDDYNYWMFTNRDGSWVIMRENLISTEYRYAIGGKNSSEAWANKTTLRYRTPAEIGE